jgi:hypothetical protein
LTLSSRQQVISNETAGSPLDQSRQLLAGLLQSQAAACCVRVAPGAKAASDKTASDKAASDAIFVIGPSHVSLGNAARMPKLYGNRITRRPRAECTIAAAALR